MNNWVKLATDPEDGGGWASPLVRTVIGVALLGLDIDALLSGNFNLGKHEDSQQLYLSEHPVAFFMVCIGLALAATWSLSSARKRYLMHGK